jgi:carbon-monoxide dehydrogenase small subunit
VSITVKINGQPQVVSAPGMTPLVTVLREELSLTGAKAACMEGFCGACTVLVDDEPVVSCLVPVGTVEGRHIRTSESLAPGNASLSRMQEAMKNADAVQCGMCFPGVLMTLTHLAETSEGIGEAELRRQLVGNACRCTGYEQIVTAALSVLNDQPSEEVEV